MSRTFRTMAFLIRPELLEWPEAADDFKRRGFTDLAFEVQETFSSVETEFSLEDIERAAPLIRERGLGVVLFTGYIKTMSERLRRHPEQRAMVVSLPGAGAGLDMWSTGATPEQGPTPHPSWGCPYHPEYKGYYLGILRRAAAIPGIVDIWLDDEARLGQATGIGCYCPNCQADFERQFHSRMPLPHQHDHPHWRDFLEWRFRRWSEVHHEMCVEVHKVNPDILCGCQVNPMVDLMGQNAWLSSVDLCDLADHQDMLTVNPYQTAMVFMWEQWGSDHAFNQQLFKPEFAFFVVWTQWLRACTPADKEVTILPQGFNPPSYARPYRAADGAWMSLVPLALGVDNLAPCFWEPFASTPAAPAFLKGTGLAHHFRRARPLPYAAVIHSFQTEVFAMPHPHVGPRCFDVRFFFPVLESLQHHAVPNTPWPDQRLGDPRLDDHKVLLLPEVRCLSTEQKEALIGALEAGKGLCAFGAVGTADERGHTGDSDFLEQCFGVKPLGKTRAGQAQKDTDYLTGGFEVAQGPSAPAADVCAIVPVAEHAIFEDLDAGYHESTLLLPARMDLRQPVHAAALPGSQVVAVLAGENGEPTDIPAIVLKEHPHGARCVWFAGVPDRPGLAMRNSARVMAVRAAQWAARSAPAARLVNYPPVTEYLKIRPNDSRTFPTWGFYPSIVDDGYLILIAAYFPEDVTFDLVLDLPPGRQIGRVVECWDENPMEYRSDPETLTIPLHFQADDYVKLVHAQWE